MLYNGTRDVPYFQKLKLSDSFEMPSLSLELTADCYNINYAKSKEILSRCHDLMAYSVFIAKVREYVKEGSSLFDAVKKSIRYCESHDLMADYFQKHESEVLDMVHFEWNATRAKEVTREEALEEGRAEGREEGRAEGRAEERVALTTQFAVTLLKNKAPMKLITESTHLSVEEVEKIAKEHQLAM